MHAGPASKGEIKKIYGSRNLRSQRQPVNEDADQKVQSESHQPSFISIIAEHIYQNRTLKTTFARPMVCDPELPSPRVPSHLYGLVCVPRVMGRGKRRCQGRTVSCNVTCGSRTSRWKEWNGRATWPSMTR